MASRETADDLFDQAEVLFEEGEFGRARRLLERLLAEEADSLDKADKAYAQYTLACCLDRRGEAVEADRRFRAAQDLDPEQFPAPSRMEPAQFEALVADALDTLPEMFDSYLAQVQIVVADYPGNEAPDPFCLGLYSGLPRTERGHDERDHLDQIFIYKRSHELEFDDEHLLEEIRKTVVHEIGHHFGLEEHEMGDYE